MSLLQKRKLKRYTVELPEDFIPVLNSHLKETFANKTRWVLDAFEKKMKEEKNEITNKIKGL